MRRVLSNRFRVCVLLALFTFLGAGDAGHAANQPGTLAVRVHPISVPVLKSGKRTTEIVTVFVVVKSKMSVRTVCYWMPRIQDSLLQTFDADPLSWKSYERLHLGGEDKRIFDVVYKAMKRSRSIRRVHAIAGDRIPRKGASWAKPLKIEICKKKKKDDKKKSEQKH